MLTYASTVLFVKDINKSKRFYCDLLELEINHDFGTNIEFKLGLSIWQITTGYGY